MQRFKPLVPTILVHGSLKAVVPFNQTG